MALARERGQTPSAPAYPTTGFCALSERHCQRGIGCCLCFPATAAVCLAAFLIHCWSGLGGAEDEGLDVGGGVGGEVGGGGALRGDFGADGSGP